MFRRRDQIPLRQRLRRWLWPHIGWRRMGTYVVKRITRLTGTPHSIAAGAACGVAISFTPFLGFHVISAFLLCLVVRGNYLAAAIGTLVGNPWTLPFLLLASYQLGHALLGGPAAPIESFQHWNLATFFAQAGGGVLAHGRRQLSPRPGRGARYLFSAGADRRGLPGGTGAAAAEPARRSELTRPRRTPACPDPPWSSAPAPLISCARRGRRRAQPRPRSGVRTRTARLKQRGDMIIGVGTDLIDIRRIERTLARFGERFLDRVFTAAERARAESAARPRGRLRQALRGQGSLRQSARHRLPPGRVLARHRRAQSAERPTGPAVERRRGIAARGPDAARHERTHRPQPDRRTAARPGRGDHQRAARGRRRPRDMTAALPFTSTHPAATLRMQIMRHLVPPRRAYPEQVSCSLRTAAVGGQGVAASGCER